MLINESKFIAPSINTSDDGEEDVLTNTIGSEDFMPDSDGSFDDHIKRQAIHGFDKGRKGSTKRASLINKRNH
jgi:hypothetical protein